MKMGFTALHALLWLLAAFTLTTQDLATLSVNPKITATCGQQVILRCDVSSSRHGLSIKHMSWYQNQTPLCSVNSEELVTTHPRNSKSAFHCDYEQGQLSLTFEEVQPMDSKQYRCKLQSNKGVSHEYTTVELQECHGDVEGAWENGRPTCTFNRVHPGGEVHWFHGSHRLKHRHSTTEHVEDGGWLTIQSYLDRESPKEPYNCSLISNKSGRYIATTLVEVNSHTIGAPVRSGVGSQGTMTTFLFILIQLVVTLK